MLSNVNLDLVPFKVSKVIIYTHNYEMRNPSAYVPNFLNFQICCILSKFKNFICAKIFDFKFSHRRERTRRGGGANFTGAAAFGGGVHPCCLAYCLLAS